MRLKGEMMRVLLTNLRHFYQCRALWGIYILVAFVLTVGVRPWMHLSRGIPGETEGISFAWMGVICGVSMTVGAIVASLQMGVISAPLSFCLPDHRTIFQKLVLLVGLVISLLVLSIEFVKDAPMSLSPACLFGVSLIAYFTGVGIGLTSRYGLMGVAFGAVLLLPMGGTLLDLKGSSEFIATTASAVAAILLGVSSAAAVWQWLGRTDLFRRRCGRPWLGVPNVWDPAAREKYRWTVASSRGRPVPTSEGDESLLRIMRSCEYGSVGRHVWGTLYAWLLPGGGGRSRIVSMGLLSLASAILVWYGPSLGPFFIANASVYGGGALPNPPVSSHLLIAGGRRERFFATMALILVLGIVVTCAFVLGFIAADSLGVPSSVSKAYGRNSMSYMDAMIDQPMNLRAIVLFVAVFPISRFLEIRLLGRQILARATQTGLLMFVGFLGLYTQPRLVTIPPVYVVLVFILSWIICAYGVHRTIMRSDLGRK